MIANEDDEEARPTGKNRKKKIRRENQRKIIGKRKI